MNIGSKAHVSNGSKPVYDCAQESDVPITKRDHVWLLGRCCWLQSSKKRRSRYLAGVRSEELALATCTLY